MIEFKHTDVLFELPGVVVSFVSNYKETGLPGLAVIFEGEDGAKIVSAPITVIHAVQMCSFMFTNLCKKIDNQDHLIQVLKEKLKTTDETKDAEVIPFRPKEI